MTVLQSDLKTIKIVLMQNRGGYTVTHRDIIQAIEALQRVVIELDTVKANA